MAAKLLRKLSQSALTTATELELGWGGGYGEYKKLEEEGAGDAKRGQYGDKDSAEGRHAYICSRENRKKKKKKVPKGYLPVLIVGTDEEEEEGGGGGDVSGDCSCSKCDVSGGCACRFWHVYVIRVCVLGHPLLGDLLRRSCQQFGYCEYEGALRLPCDPPTFENLLTLITS